MRTRLCFWVLLLVPFVVYLPAIFQDYGMRDDYSHLREAREEPGKLVRFTASQGRPLYGALLETSFSQISTVDELRWLRLASVGLLVCIGMALWRQLDNSGWHELDAAAFGLAVTFLPAAQIAAGWAIGWGWSLSVLLGIAGYAAVELEIEKGGLQRVMGVVGGLFIYSLAIMIYPSNAMFAVVPLAGTTLQRVKRQTTEELLRWFLTHLAVIVAALLLCFLALRWLYTAGIFTESARMALDLNPFTKFAWFLWQPLPNALGLFALRDDYHTGEIFFWLAVLAVGGFLYWVIRHDLKELPQLDKLKWLLCIGFLPFVAHAVSLIAAERSTGYRTLFALSGLVLVVLFVAIRRIPIPDPKKQRVVRLGVMGTVLATGAVLACYQTFALVAQPQAREWQMIHDAVMNLRLKGKTSIYVIESTPEFRTTDRVHRDEFGSLSTDSEWVPKEMVNDVLHERFPKGLPKNQQIVYAQGKNPPPEGTTYDLVIDMRKLKQYRE